MKYNYNFSHNFLPASPNWTEVCKDVPYYNLDFKQTKPGRLLLSKLPVRIGLHNKKQITAMVLNEEILSIIEDTSPNWTAGLYYKQEA